MGSRRSISVDEGANIRNKHQVLLQEYLVLQKECVSKKRKLKEAKERKDALLDEIRFLKQRRRFLSEIQSQNTEREQDIDQSQKPNAKYNIEANGRKSNPTEPGFQNPQPAIGSTTWNSGGVGKEKVGLTPLRAIGKKPKDLFSNGKRADKRKISWQDQVALKV